MNHTLITMAALAVATFFGTQWWVLVFMAGFWFGREHSQAEYRWLTVHKANRSRMPWYAGFLPISWNRDGLVNDLLVPVVTGLIFCLLFKYGEYVWSI